MNMLATLVWLLAASAVTLAARIVNCPGNSFCDGHVEEHSFKFLEELSTKQRQQIVSLKITNASLEEVIPELKYLKKLAQLDLSYNNINVNSFPALPNLKVLKLNGNNIKRIHFSQLPRNLEELDLTDNLLAQIPEDWQTLRHLKKLHLSNNQINCDCSNVLKYKGLLKDSIIISGDIMCYSPLKYKGANIANVDCSVYDSMFNDQAVEGSGNGLHDGDPLDLSGINQLQEQEDDATDSNTFIDDHNDLPGNEEEGSGEEGSGSFPIVATCHVNCSTPVPIRNENKSGDPLHPGRIGQIILEDLNVWNKPTTTTTTTSSSTVTIPTSPPIIKTVANVVETIPNNVNSTGKIELEKSSMAPENNITPYIIIGICLLLAVVFILLFVRKRHNRSALKEKNLQYPDCQNPDELSPMNKHTVDSVNEKNVIPEAAPLINGNSKSPDDAPILQKTPLLSAPEIIQHPSPDVEIIDETVDIRIKPVSELLTPQRERVTIRASEILDSPKTPVLVHRQKNSDGTIVTTSVKPL